MHGILLLSGPWSTENGCCDAQLVDRPLGYWSLSCTKSSLFRLALGTFAPRSRPCIFNNWPQAARMALAEPTMDAPNCRLYVRRRSTSVGRGPCPLRLHPL
ncbi:hypothetical protein FA95DRAFT_1557313 [Auriscalpium vulgare]|uniref:Uncharacterized protein n=1 Tax=Auriscalpium vulgare TaxID=40419 RepID=A0ACB8RYL5_9AGAM|nr:hypothetical protein FA95DRAFT_1557313 [Auriscalpium vulgare]